MPDINLQIATPERLLLNEQVSEVEIPGREGYIGVLPGHAPLISELAHGVLRYVAQGNTVRVSILGGFVEILDDKVRILADSALRKEEIDLEKAHEDLRRAQELMGHSAVNADPAQALDDAQRAQALIDTASH